MARKHGLNIRLPAGLSWFLLLMTAVPPVGSGASAINALRLTSPAYRNHAGIPARFTCDGRDISPPLAWSGAPAGTRSFVLILEDPDAPNPAAPQMTWIHWLLYDIPASVHALPEGGSTHLPAGTRARTNSWKRTAYGGPCPPIGRHRYFHLLYALDVVLPDLHAPGKARLEIAMRGHVLAEAQLIGTYRRTH